MVQSVGAATTGTLVIILRRHLISGICIHLPHKTYLSGKPVDLLERWDKRQPGTRTGWLVNRNVMMVLPAGSDLFRIGQICPGNPGGPVRRGLA
jgi:hypothetical protein